MRWTLPGRTSHGEGPAIQELLLRSSNESMRYCRELYLNLMIGINWVPTKEQIADLFTKPLDKTTFLYLRTLLMSSGQTAL